jgi:hypothetical protein
MVGWRAALVALVAVAICLSVCGPNRLRFIDSAISGPRNWANATDQMQRNMNVPGTGRGLGVLMRAAIP